MNKALAQQVTTISRFLNAPRTKIVYEVKLAGYNIQLRKRSANNFTVVYGAQVKPSLTYYEATHELGACIMHALACEGRLD